MPDRLTSLDASFLYLEESTTAMHVGSVMVFEPPRAGFDLDRLVRIIEHRIGAIPRFRQKVRDVPARIANPVWVDDENFDLSYHVRRAALPRPGTDRQLQDFVSRVQPRKLDRTRPLWEIYLVEGLEGGRFALVTKTHHALIDGVHALDIAHLLVDAEPGDRTETEEPGLWEPQRAPSGAELVTGALLDVVRRPTQVIDLVRGGLNDALNVGLQAVESAGAVLGALARTAARPAPDSPLNTAIGSARRWAMIASDLEDYRTVRTRLAKGPYAEDVTVNDVILATIAGGLRTWLLGRGEPVGRRSVVRAMVPVSVYGDDPTGLYANEVMACVVDLPVGEPGASMRLHQIAFAMRQQMEVGQAVGARSLANLAGFAPPTLHALGARLGSAMSRRLYNVMVTNVPGPQMPLYAGEAKMVSTYPVTPLAKGQALAVGVTSYNGGVFYGLNADRDAMPDVDVLGESIVDALAELASGREG
ncbi:MAG TPA: wax ester/triacylglycerol synthase family O-acyltransferase [Intrasporangium sp.]|uniref:WS/DGAT/MGAT family O-acyltransferase n=1 Tax=Intrasporangium sp. TaxID=1925024 RepID=UPI002D77A21B|nr:wax ester/triacylglycerol synthase family O-acyltransferase [Intrasporangium sp.]HET7399996.1 wax ester/triacylglycerol synthase family O-acyltransferase [Intrasporangium sp.]